jgi:hypothetical protein
MKTDEKIINILLAGTYGMRPVEAIWNDGGWIAVHYTRGRESFADYTITHIPTGKRICFLHLREQAIRFAKALADGIDWNFDNDRIPIDLKEKYQTIKSCEEFKGFEFG